MALMRPTTRRASASLTIVDRTCCVCFMTLAFPGAPLEQSPAERLTPKWVAQLHIFPSASYYNGVQTSDRRHPSIQYCIINCLECGAYTSHQMAWPLRAALAISLLSQQCAALSHFLAW